MSRITDAFTEAFTQYAPETAVVFRQGRSAGRRTFAELSGDVQRMRAYFAAQGVQAGERILAFALPSYDLCVCMIAALMTGTPVMYVDIHAKQDSLRRVFADYRPDMVLVSGGTQFLRPFFREIGKIRRVIRTDRFAGMPPADPPRTGLPEDTTALLTMTTGSTGQPKIAVRSHRDLLHQLTLIRENLDAQGQETVLTTSYMYIFANLLNGFTTVMPMLHLGKDSPRTIQRKLLPLRNEPVTMLITSPDFCLQTQSVFPHLRTVYCGGAILNLHEARQIRRNYPGCRCNIVYGSTECAVIAVSELDDYLRTLQKTGCSVLGKPVSGVRVRLAGDGEILVASAALLAHYLTGDAGKETDDSGALWHHTGDMGKFHDGTLCFRGKRGRTVTAGDRTFYSNELEQAIVSRFDALPKCAVLEHRGQIHIWVQPPYPEKPALAALLSGYGITDFFLHRTCKIPCDVKHHTKIHYEKLKEQLP